MFNINTEFVKAILVSFKNYDFRTRCSSFIGTNVHGVTWDGVKLTESCGHSYVFETCYGYESHIYTVVDLEKQQYHFEYEKRSFVLSDENDIDSTHIVTETSFSSKYYTEHGKKQWEDPIDIDEFVGYITKDLYNFTRWVDKHSVI